MDKISMSGAMIERGRVIGIDDGGRLKIESLTRYGVVTPYLDAPEGAEYHAGDTVCFFMFDDGDGRVL